MREHKTPHIGQSWHIAQRKRKKNSREWHLGCHSVSRILIFKTNRFVKADAGICKTSSLVQTYLCTNLIRRLAYSYSELKSMSSSLLILLLILSLMLIVEC